MSSSLLLGGENTGRLDNVLGTGAAPLDVGRVTLVEDGDLRAVDNKLAILVRDLSLEATVCGIIFELKEKSIFRTNQ